MTDPKKLLESDTFCVMPWINDYKGVDQQRQLCCVANPQRVDDGFYGPTMDASRKKLWNGERVPECHSCWHQEDSNLTSNRQSFNKKWLTSSDLSPRTKEYFSNFNEHTPPKKLFYDIRAGSKCNLSCIMCDWRFSSLWRQELGIPEVDYKVELDYEDIRENAEEIYFAGGEPLIIDEYINLLKFLASIKSKIKINLNTNLTSLKPEVIEYIKELNCSLMISADSAGLVQEYQRYPLKWEKFTRNLDRIKEFGIPIAFQTTVTAISVLGWEGFAKLEEYNPKNWHLYPVVTPPELRVENLPDHLKQYAYDQISHMTQTKTYTTCSKFKEGIDYLLRQVMMPGDTKGLRTFINTLDTRRNINHADYLGVNLLIEKD